MYFELIQSLSTVISAVLLAVTAQDFFSTIPTLGKYVMIIKVSFVPEMQGHQANKNTQKFLWLARYHYSIFSCILFY